MDYFYILNRAKGSRTGSSALSTKELKKRLDQMGKSTQGARHVLLRRYEGYRQEEEGQDEGEETPVEEGRVAPHASDSPMMVMVDETTGNKYMRAVPNKGLGEDGDHSWLVQDMHQELKSWGHPGGPRMPSFLRVMENLPSWLCVRHWPDATVA